MRIWADRRSNLSSWAFIPFCPYLLVTTMYGCQPIRNVARQTAAPSLHYWEQRQWVFWHPLLWCWQDEPLPETWSELCTVCAELPQNDATICCVLVHIVNDVVCSAYDSFAISFKNTELYMAEITGYLEAELMRMKQLMIWPFRACYCRNLSWSLLTIWISAYGRRTQKHPSGLSGTWSCCWNRWEHSRGISHIERSGSWHVAAHQCQAPSL